MPVLNYRGLFFGLAVVTNLLLILAYLFRPTIDIRFPPNKISFHDGELYTYPVGNPKHFLYDFSGDNDRGEGEQSTLELFENGKPLGPAHRPHRKIAELGRGRYSHWEETVFFSSSDGTDPRTNRYLYAARSKARVKPGLWIGLLSWLAVAVLPLIGNRLTIAYTTAAPLVFRSLTQGFTLSRRSKRWLLLAAIALNTLLLLAYAYRPMVEFTLSPDKITPQHGNAYVFPAVALIGFPYELPGDNIGANSRSTLRLYENGKPIGPAHAVHDEIREKGMGLFSHWDNVIVFSSSDKTAPTANGYAYTARGKPRLKAILWIPSIVLLTAAAFLAGGQKMFNYAAIWLLPNPIASSKVMPHLVLITAIGIACGCVLYKWHTGQTLSLGVAGFLPISDAHGYWECATWIEKGGASHFVENSFMRDWCSRRIIYPSFLSGLLRMTDWFLPAVLLLQANLIAVAIAALSLVSATRLGIAAAAMVFYLLFDFANTHAFGVLMTEATGLAAGIPSAALLIRAIHSKRLSWLYSGLALFSIAMISRAGAMFALPLLLLWSFRLSFEWIGWKRALPLAAACCIAAIGCGMILQKILIFILGMNSGASFGNFSTTLYRLSIGANSWQSAYSDNQELFAKLPESEAFKAIYRIAFDNIKAHPEILINTYLRDGGRHLETLLNFDHQIGFPAIFLGLFLLGTVRCLIRWREPFHLLLLTVVVGEIIATPLLYTDGGARIFAATIAFRSLMASLGLFTFLKCCFWFAKLVQLKAGNTRMWRPDPASDPSIPFYWSLAVGGMVVILIVLPYTGILAYSNLNQVSGIRCPAATRSASLRLDRESIAFSVVAHQTDFSVLPYRIAYSRLQASLNRNDSPNPWFTESFLKLSPPTLIIQGINLSREEFQFMDNLHLIWRGPPPPLGATIGVCIDVTVNTEIAGATYSEITKLQVLSNPPPWR